MNLSLNDINVDTIPEDKLDQVLFELEFIGKRSTKEWLPHAKQKEFHCAKENIRLILGGNRSGKTVAGCAEALMHSTGLYPDWYPYEQRMRTPNIGRIIVSEYSKGYGETVLPNINTWLPKSMIASSRNNHEGYPAKYILKNGSSFDICTHDQENKVFEGWHGHWAWFDEPPPRDKYIATMRGLIDFNGRVWLTLTPLTEAWIWDELVQRKDGSVSMTQVNTHDNPFISKAGIKEFEKMISPEEKEARIQGKFLHLSGLVYKTFDRNVHLKSFNLDQLDSTYSKMQKKWFFVLDPHDRRPHCGMWAFVNPQQKKFVAYELYREDTISDLCAYILAFEKIHKIPSESVTRIGDPNKLETPSAVSGLKLKMEFLERSNGKIFFLTKLDDDITKGHLIVKENLSYNKEKELDTYNSPSLYFNDYQNIPHVIEHMEKYMYQDWKGLNKDSRSPKETPKDLNKDMPDCIRYFLMTNPAYEADFVKEDNFMAKRSITGYH